MSSSKQDFLLGLSFIVLFVVSLYSVHGVPIGGQEESSDDDDAFDDTSDHDYPNRQPLLNKLDDLKIPDGQERTQGNWSIVRIATPIQDDINSTLNKNTKVNDPPFGVCNTVLVVFSGIMVLGFCIIVVLCCCMQKRINYFQKHSTYIKTVDGWILQYRRPNGTSRGNKRQVSNSAVQSSESSKNVTRSEKTLTELSQSEKALSQEKPNGLEKLLDSKQPVVPDSKQTGSDQSPSGATKA